MLGIKLKKGMVVSGLVFLMVAIAMPARAYQFTLGNADIQFNSTFSYGISARVQHRDYDLIGKTNNPEYLANPDFYYEGSGNVPPGAWSINGDDGTGVYSNVFKASHDLDVRMINDDLNLTYGIFARGHYFYDFYLMEHGTDYVDVIDNEDAKEQHGRNIDLLDAYIYGDIEISEIPVAIRAGRQVINWGENAYIPHGISDFNPIDVSRLRVPGAELKEAFMPMAAVWIMSNVSDAVSFEGFYQLEWENSQTDAPGTYFSTNDFIGEGGDYIHVHFAQEPDIHPLTNRADLRRDMVPLWGERLDDQEASDSGQFGLKLSYIAAFLNDTELSFYYINYHNHRPVLSGYAIDVNNPAQPWVTGQAVYTEDIQLYGGSFNSVLPGGFSIAGECSYRIDEPLQIDDVELLIKLLEPINVVSHTDGPRGSQIKGIYEPGEYVQGYEFFDTFQSQFTLAKLFGPKIGADQFVMLTEVGSYYVTDMPDQDELRFDAAGTHRSGNPAREGDGGVWAGPDELEGTEENRFADDFSWGYKLKIILQYNDAFMGLNCSPTFLFTHDVNGTTPTPINLFIQHRRSLTSILKFDYMQKYTFDLGHKMYWGAGTANGLSDRDYVFMNFKFSI